MLDIMFFMALKELVFFHEPQDAQTLRFLIHSDPMDVVGGNVHLNSLSFDESVIEYTGNMRGHTSI